MYSPSTSKTFVLKLQLHDQIVPENCTWSRAAVSRIVVTLVKKERGLWGDLLGVCTFFYIFYVAWLEYSSKCSHMVFYERPA